MQVVIFLIEFKILKISNSHLAIYYLYSYIIYIDILYTYTFSFLAMTAEANRTKALKCNNSESMIYVITNTK